MTMQIGMFGGDGLGRFQSLLFPGNDQADRGGVMPGPTEGTDMRVVTILNQKGGCGKSSCTYHLAGAFSAKGLRVLLADMDPQSSISQGFWGPTDTRALDPEETVAALFPGNRPHPSQVIKQTGIPRVDIIPGSRAATKFNTPEPWNAPAESQACLRDLLEEVSESYDVVLCDCPPNLHLCSWAAMVASDHLIIPLQPEDFGAMGIMDVQESIAMVRAVANPGLNVLGYLLTMVSPRKTLHQAFEETLRSLYGADVFENRFLEAIAYAESITKRMPIEQYKPKGAPAKDIRALADEILARMDAAAVGSRMEVA
jgi:chromosome partitioning protein